MKRKRNIGQEILEGIEDIKEWQQGRKSLKVTRQTLPGADDVITIRHKLGMSQQEFSDFMGVSIRTLQNWEQHRREPRGPAKSLLQVADKVPGAILKAFPRLGVRAAHGHSHHGHVDKK